MNLNKLLLPALGLSILANSCYAEKIAGDELENGSLLPGYTGISVLASGDEVVVAYGNGDGVIINTQISGVPGQFRLDIRGASTDTNAAGISVYLGDKKIGATSFNSTGLAIASITFNLESSPSNSELRFELETDDGSNDTLLDSYELHRIADIPPPPAAPVLPEKGAYESGIYRNMFQELGYTAAQINARLNEVYDQLFHSTDTANKALFIPVGDDMAYIWDVHNNDVRSEGMSYGMMMAVQMDRQDDFNKLWKWANTYSLNKSGDNKGYFAWQVGTAGNVLDANPAPDGEEYFATALFFAAHRWGNGEGIYNYEAQANQILKDMFGNGQTRYNNSGQLEEFSLFSHADKQIVFSPATPTDRNWTDTSYHLPAFYELWAKWADNNNVFWAEIADVSRQHFKDASHPETGLTPDYAYFDGSPHGDFQHWKDTFQYDAWRVISNVAMDYAWWKKDEWQVTHAKRLQTYFKGKGIDSYSSLLELDGEPYEGNSQHSQGLVAMNAIASLASDSPDAWEFVDAFWNTPIPEGRHRYYDGSLYMFGMLAMSGNYRIYCPNNECDAVTEPAPANRAPIANDDSVTIVEGNIAAINVVNNDTDADNDTLSISTYTQAVNGTVSQNNGNELSYTPKDGFTGTDSFSYIVTDGSEESKSATVTVTVTADTTIPVNQAPIANDDSVIIVEGNSATINVVKNDTDADNDTLSISTFTQSKNGSVSKNGDNLIYIPNDGFTGTDNFTYMVTDGSENSKNATVTVTVTADTTKPVNQAPIANDDSVIIVEGSAANINVVKNDTDADNDTLSISTFTQATNGSVSKNGDNLTYTPNDNFTGIDSFSYMVTDGSENSKSATVTVTVTEDATEQEEDDKNPSGGGSILFIFTLPLLLLRRMTRR